MFCIWFDCLFRKVVCSSGHCMFGFGGGGFFVLFMAFYGILQHFGIFAKKSNKISNPIFPILSDFFRFFSIFRLFPTS